MQNLSVQNNPTVVTHQGRMITYATACPQDFAFPTDVNLLNDAGEMSELLIDVLHRVAVCEKRNHVPIARLQEGSIYR